MEFFKNWGVVALFLAVVLGTMYLIMELSAALIDWAGILWTSVIFALVVSFLFTFFVTFIQELEKEEKED